MSTVPDYRKASELNPRDDGLVNALAVTLQNLGRTRESIDEFGRAIAMAPSNGLYYMNRSRSWPITSPRFSRFPA